MTERRPWLKRLSLALVDRGIVEGAAAVHFTSQAERMEASLLNISMRSVVIPLGIEAERPADASIFLERFPQADNAQTILFLSRLDPKKNVEGLLKSFSLLAGRLPSTKLVIAGGGPIEYVSALRDLSVELGIADAVLWTGHLEGELKSSAFAVADVFVLPSFSENFGIAAVEAMIAGVPCVLASGVALAKEVAEAKAGLLVEPMPESIALALTRLLSDEPSRLAMAANARSLARDLYSLAAMGTRLAELYERLISPVGRKNPIAYS